MRHYAKMMMAARLAQGDGERYDAPNNYRYNYPAMHDYPDYDMTEMRRRRDRKGRFMMAEEPYRRDMQPMHSSMDYEPPEMRRRRDRMGRYMPSRSHYAEPYEDEPRREHSREKQMIGFDRDEEDEESEETEDNRVGNVYGDIYALGVALPDKSQRHNMREQQPKQKLPAAMHEPPTIEQIEKALGAVSVNTDEERRRAKDAKTWLEILKE